MKSQPYVYGLEKFGLTIRDLRKLGSRRVKLHTYVRHVNEQALFRYSPKERKARMHKWYQTIVEKTANAWPTRQFTILRSGSRPYGFAATLAAADVSKLLRLTGLKDIWIESIQGRKPRKIRNAPRWYTVHAVFAIQVEEQEKGNQTFEDRFVAVKATSFGEAVRKLRPEFRQYGEPHLNPDGFMVRWQFERIVDVYDTYEEELNGPSVEVFSALKSRRMRADLVWNPRRAV